MLINNLWKFLFFSFIHHTSVYLSNHNYAIKFINYVIHVCNISAPWLPIQKKSHNSDVYTFFNSLSANPTKMAKHTQTIPWQQPTNYFSVFDHFMGLALKGLIYCQNSHSLILPISISHSWKNIVLIKSFWWTQNI